jgi:hypothetical protein
MPELICPECSMPIKFGKTVWFFNGKSYHPECVQDNSNLYAQWIQKELYGGDQTKRKSNP